MLNLNLTLLVQVVNFIVFLAIMNVIFFRPVGAAIAKRRAHIEHLAKSLEELQHEAKALYGEAESRRAAARRETDHELTRVRTEIARETDAILTTAQAEAATLVAKAQLEVEREIESARTGEDRIVAQLADDLVGRAVGGAA